MQGGARSKILKIPQNSYLCLIKQVLEHFRARGARGCKGVQGQNYLRLLFLYFKTHIRPVWSQSCKGVQGGARGCKEVQGQNYSKFLKIPFYV